MYKVYSRGYGHDALPVTHIYENTLPFIQQLLTKLLLYAGAHLGAGNTEGQNKDHSLI